MRKITICINSLEKFQKWINVHTWRGNIKRSYMGKFFGFRVWHVKEKYRGTIKSLKGIDKKAEVITRADGHLKQDSIDVDDERVMIRTYIKRYGGIKADKLSGVVPIYLGPNFWEEFVLEVVEYQG